jgi:hypothetical protein
MSEISFNISPNHGKSKGRDENIPQFVANPPTPKKGVIRIQVFSHTGKNTWTTGSIVTQPR